jgi:hypothetical protein
MLSFSVAAIQVVLWQSTDLAVDIVSEDEEGNKEVTISVSNKAGSTLLFYENDQVSGKIEYLSEDGWVEYCNVYYTVNNTQAISPEYGGTFAELAPGEDWDIVIPSDKVDGMKSGTYRIKMTYITKNKYNKYLNNSYDAYKNESESSIEDESDIDSDIKDESETTDENSGYINMNGNADNGVSESEEESKEEFLASSLSEVFIKTFEYVAPDQMVRAISFDGEVSDGAFDGTDPYETSVVIENSEN